MRFQHSVKIFSLLLTYFITSIVAAENTVLYPNFPHKYEINQWDTPFTPIPIYRSDVEGIHQYAIAQQDNWDGSGPKPIYRPLMPLEYPHYEIKPDNRPHYRGESSDYNRKPYYSNYYDKQSHYYQPEDYDSQQNYASDPTILDYRSTMTDNDNQDYKHYSQDYDYMSPYPYQKPYQSYTYDNYDYQDNPERFLEELGKFLEEWGHYMPNLPTPNVNEFGNITDQYDFNLRWKNKDYHYDQYNSPYYSTPDFNVNPPINQHYYND